MVVVFEMNGNKIKWEWVHIPEIFDLPASLPALERIDPTKRSVLCFNFNAKVHLSAEDATDMPRMILEAQVSSYMVSTPTKPYYAKSRLRCLECERITSIDDIRVKYIYSNRYTGWAPHQ